MPQTFVALQCAFCNTFQGQLDKKSKKFSCVICNAKQSFRTIFAVSNSGKDIRLTVQQHNELRGARDELQGDPQTQQQLQQQQQQQAAPSTQVVQTDWQDFAAEGVDDLADAIDDESGFVTALPDAQLGKRQQRGTAPTATATGSFKQHNSKRVKQLHNSNASSSSDGPQALWASQQGVAHKKAWKQPPHHPQQQPIVFKSAVGLQAAVPPAAPAAGGHTTKQQCSNPQQQPVGTVQQHSWPPLQQQQQQQRQPLQQRLPPLSQQSHTHLRQEQDKESAYSRTEQPGSRQQQQQWCGQQGQQQQQQQQPTWQQRQQQQQRPPWLQQQQQQQRPPWLQQQQQSRTLNQANPNSLQDTVSTSTHAKQPATWVPRPSLGVQGRASTPATAAAGAKATAAAAPRAKPAAAAAAAAGAWGAFVDDGDAAGQVCSDDEGGDVCFVTDADVAAQWA